MSEPKILFIDVETLPNVSWTWGKYDQNVLGFEKQTCIATVAAKWQGNKEVFAFALPEYADYKAGSYDDKLLVKQIWDLLDEADIAVAHNGNDFDFRVITGRFLFHGMKPPSPYKKIDTKLISSRVARFNSNKLDDLGKHFGFGEKIKTNFDLWLGCMRGDMKCWRNMVKYNKQDVILLEKVYNRFLPYIADHPNQALYKQDRVCPKCGAKRFVSKGLAFANTRAYRRLCCLSCGGWLRETVSVEKTGVTNAAS